MPPLFHWQTRAGSGARYRRLTGGTIEREYASLHGRAETIEQFLTRFDYFEFVQIQINYLDWSLQGAGKKVEVIAKRGLPVIAMEPVRGGRLAKLPPDAEALFKRAAPGQSIASWAFRYPQSLPHVTVVLSQSSYNKEAQAPAVSRGL